MGLSNFPSPAEGVLPLILMNTVMSVALIKNKLASVLRRGGGGDAGSRRVSTTRCGGRAAAAAECCVCLCGFEADEEVSELSCRHFFHKPCLDRWFDNQRLTCPLCRSVN